LKHIQVVNVEWAYVRYRGSPAESFPAADVSFEHARGACKRRLCGMLIFRSTLRITNLIGRSQDSTSCSL